MASTFLISHPDCLLHEPGEPHPESPRRLRSILDWIEDSPVRESVQFLRPDPAEIRWIDAVHSPEYRRMVACAYERGLRVLDEGDTRISPGSHRAALLAAGAALLAVDSVFNEPSAVAFALPRPPGHHALRERAMGFCLYNNAAVAAQYARQHYGLERVAILDWDVHHGNGTQAIFEEDGQVLCVSLHQAGIYPGTGTADETGSGPGEGATLNLPLPAGSGRSTYESALEDSVWPTLRRFQPELILVSNGFDAHVEDPLGGMALETADFAWLASSTRSVARELCGGRLVLLLEGGYNLRALARGVEAQLMEMVKA